MPRAGKYGVIDSDYIPGGQEISRDEPVFLLRAQDALAVQALSMYMALAEDTGCEYEFVHGIAECRDDFIAWQKNHSIKIPD